MRAATRRCHRGIGQRLRRSRRTKLRATPPKKRLSQPAFRIASNNVGRNVFHAAAEVRWVLRGVDLPSLCRGLGAGKRNRKLNLHGQRQEARGLARLGPRGRALLNAPKDAAVNYIRITKVRRPCRNRVPR